MRVRAGFKPALLSASAFNGGAMLNGDSMIQMITSRLPIIAVCSFAVLNSACSLFSPEQPKLSASEACVKINALVADHENNFKQVRGARQNSKRIANMQVWNAERVFPLARNCQIWEWSSGLTNYICAWNESSELEAKISHDKGADLLGRCLGTQWQSNFVTTQRGGGRTLFYQEGGKTVVSVRYFRESRTILENWKATLYVGDESNLKAKVQ